MFKLLDYSPRKTNLFIQACKNGDLATVQRLLHSRFGRKPDIRARDDEGFWNAARHNHWHILRYLMDNSKHPAFLSFNREDLKKIIRFCINFDHMNVLDFFMEERIIEPDMQSLISWMAVAHGKMEVCYMLHNHQWLNEPKTQEEIIIQASNAGQKDILSFVLTKTPCENLGPSVFNKALRHAIVENKPDIVDYLLHSDEVPYHPSLPSFTDDVYRELLLKKNTEVENYLLTHDPLLSKKFRVAYVKMINRSFNGSLPKTMLHNENIYVNVEQSPFNFAWAKDNNLIDLAYNMMKMFKKNEPFYYHMYLDAFSDMCHAQKNPSLYQTLIEYHVDVIQPDIEEEIIFL